MKRLTHPRNNKGPWAALLACALAAAGLAGCAGGGEAAGASPSFAGASPASSAGGAWDAADFSGEWDAASAIPIDLNAPAAASGVAVAAGSITITQAGTYVCSGSYAGQLVVDAGKNDTVRLVLSGAQITCQDSAPLYIKKAGKAVVTLAAGSENSLTDGAAYVFGAGEEEPDAALFSKADLVLGGTGALAVTGNYLDGIAGKDSLVIAAGSYTITAVGDGVRGKDNLTVLGGSFTIQAGEDGMKSSNDSDAALGWVRLQDGTYQIDAGGDGIQAETALQIDGGTYQITTGGGAAAAPARQGAFGGGRGGPGGGMTPPDGTMAPPEGSVAPPEGAMTPPEGSVAPPDGAMTPPEGGAAAGEAPATPQAGQGAAGSGSADQESDVSRKGLKAGTALTIAGGTFALDTEDDAVHSNGELGVTGGTFTVRTGDDGFHADGGLTVAGGTLSIAQSYEGLEGATVEISGGDITLAASDDGINAAGGSDGALPGQDAFAQRDSYFIRISGGTVRLDAAGDGLDANGGLYLTGGVTLVNGPTSGGNGALDYDGACEISGGVLLAAGSAGMAQAPDADSAQPSLLVYFTAAQPAGTLVSLSDSAGNPIVSFAPQKEFQTLVISAPALRDGEGYTLSAGGSCAGPDDGGYYGDSAISGGEKLCDITLSGAVTAVNSDGTPATAGRGMGGRGGHRGMDGAQAAGAGQSLAQATA